MTLLKIKFIWINISYPILILSDEEVKLINEKIAVNKFLLNIGRIK